MSKLGDRLKEKLVEVSKGQMHTFGFVQMFMDMIDEAEKEIDSHSLTTLKGDSE